MVVKIAGYLSMGDSRVSGVPPQADQVSVGRRENAAEEKRPRQALDVSSGFRSVSQVWISNS